MPPGSRAQTQQLRHAGLVALRHVGSSWIRDQTCLMRWQADSLPLSHQRNREVGVLSHYFVAVAPLVEKILFSPLNCLDTVVENWLTVDT